LVGIRGLSVAKGKKKSAPPAPKTVGQPTKYNEERHKLLIQIISNGNSIATAAKFARVDQETVSNWIRRGREGDKLYAQFAEDYDKATAVLPVAAASTLMKGVQAGDLDAAWKVLERREKRWAKKASKMELTGADEGPIEVTSPVDYSKLSVAELRQLRALREKAKRDS
jgi:hypothetical protein